MISQKYEGRIDPTLKAAIGAIRETMTLLLQSNAARTYRRSGQYARYLAYLAARPELARRLMSHAPRTSESEWMGVVLRFRSSPEIAKSRRPAA